jgi:hypothetical protein
VATHHYALPDGLFRVFLDETMCYSSAEDGALAQAQRRKIGRLLDYRELTAAGWRLRRHHQRGDDRGGRQALLARLFPGAGGPAGPAGPDRPASDDHAARPDDPDEHYVHVDRQVHLPS